MNLQKIWPTIYRTANTFLYFIFSIIKTMASIALKQIRN